ncbi:aldose epimerase family protein [Ancylomarina longa]|uniref:Aldose 1-epimerase n=1 Tax=Ancylomarina longa TaxID=2487017 RepID=A0A434AYP0_9BACT|nr:aldose epimerase family protein [Ancylomarina longa]RUT79693.1 galactose mutarotase [Ancylomarina longa]
MIDVTDFGIAPNGEKVQLYTLKNEKGMTAKITNYGGILTSLLIPVSGKNREVVLGFDDLDEYTNTEYISNCPYFGALIGRYGNRINKGKFRIGDKDFQLNCNLGDHHLHGGLEGFDKKIWKAEILSDFELKLSYTSPDGEENFPGKLAVDVIYTLTNENELQIKYQAVTDQTTPINLTQHSYFNLSEQPKDILDHQLKINTDYILETDDSLIPGGQLLEVENTVFDFRTKKTIQQDIEELENYDDCFAFKESTKEPRKVAELTDEKDTLTMEIHTTFPGLQLYSGKYIDAGKMKKFGPFAGVAIEAQGYPDAPNHPNFKHGWLHPGEIYKQQTNYRFIF